MYYKKTRNKVVTTFGVVALAASSSFAASIAFDFEDGTVQGWTNQLTPTLGSTAFGVVNTANSFAVNGNHGLGPTPFGDRDDQGDVGLLARSTTFMFESGATLSISAELTGGDEGTAIGSDSDASLTQATTTGGFQGIALRRDSDGVYLLSGGKSGTGNPLETVSWDNAAIAAAIAGDAAGESYTIDFIDTGGGGWGWVGLDDVVIAGVVPEPSSTALLGLGAIALLGQRRRSK